MATGWIRNYQHKGSERKALSSVSLDGVQEAIASFQGAVDEMIDAFAAGLYTEAELVMADSKANYCPVGQPPEDKTPGTLRNSGFVNLPVREGISISVTLGYGGPAEEYALRQHEELTYKHTVGEAKYLETPMLKAAQGIDDRLADQIRAKTGLTTNVA